MRGGIHKKGNYYYAVVYDGIDPGTGKKRRSWIPAGTRRSDAEKVLAEEIKRRHDGVPVPTEKLTFGQYLTDRWLPIQKSRVRHSTYDSYRRNIELHVLPALGRRPIERLTPDDIDVFYATLLTEGRKKPTGSKANGRRGTSKTPTGDGDEVDDKPVGLAPKTVRNIHLMLNKAMNDAQRKGIVIRNVVSLADAPTLRRAARKATSMPGTSSSSGRSSTRFGTTGSTPRSTCRLTQGCAAGRCSGCGGGTSTSMPVVWRCARRWCRWPTRCRSRT